MSNVSDNDIRIAVAKACGWVERVFDHGRCIRFEDPENQCLRSFERLPDYPNDLNACAEFERTLSEKEELFYLVNLTRAMSEPATIGWQIERTYKATARQRCEAFLRTKNQWPPGQGIICIACSGGNE